MLSCGAVLHYLLNMVKHPDCISFNILFEISDTSELALHGGGAPFPVDVGGCRIHLVIIAFLCYGPSGVFGLPFL